MSRKTAKNKRKKQNLTKNGRNLQAIVNERTVKTANQPMQRMVKNGEHRSGKIGEGQIKQEKTVVVKKTACKSEPEIVIDRAPRRFSPELSDLQNMRPFSDESVVQNTIKEIDTAKFIKSTNEAGDDQQQKITQKRHEQRAKVVIIDQEVASVKSRRHRHFSVVRVTMLVMVFGLALAGGFGIGNLIGNALGKMKEAGVEQVATVEDEVTDEVNVDEKVISEEFSMKIGVRAATEQKARKEAEKKAAEEARLKAEEEARRQAELRAQQAVSSGRKLVALTFDDGPSYATTARLLDILREKNVKATFFVVGNMANGAPELVRREEAEGHEVGGHTTAHVNFAYMNAEQTQAEFAAMNQIFNNILGHSSRIMRPPYGNYTEVTQTYAGQPMIYWTVDTLDWKYRDAAWVRQNTVNSTFDGAIILMHDIHPTTIDAVAGVIDDLRAQGYEFLTVSELAQARGVTMVNGGVYGSFR